MTEQVTLPLEFARRASLDTFYSGANREVFEVVSNLATSLSPGLVYLHGALESGRSHLLQGAAAIARARHQVSAYIPLGEPGIQAELLPQLNACGLLCFDDLERVAGDETWERNLLDLFERAQSDGGRLLLAACAPPGAVGLHLADLVSRLSSRLVYRVRVLDAVERARALRWEARRRGLDISPATIEWLMRRVPRGTAALFDLLDKVDRASLEENRKVTIPFLRGMGIG